MAIFAGGPPNLKGIKYLTYCFATIIHSSDPTFVPSLSEIGDLSCITSYLVLPGFLVDTLLKLTERLLAQLRLSNLVNKICYTAW